MLGHASTVTIIIPDHAKWFPVKIYLEGLVSDANICIDILLNNNDLRFATGTLSNSMFVKSPSINNHYRTFRVMFHRTEDTAVGRIRVSEIQMRYDCRSE